MSAQPAPAPTPNPAEKYESFLVPIIFEPWSHELISRVRLAPGEHVLDVACGTGAVSFNALNAVGPGGSVTGADISPGMLAVARRKADERGAVVTFVEANAEHPPARGGGYDAALIQQGLQFFPDSVAALKATRAVLRTGGRIAIAVWHAIDQQDVFPQLNAAIKAELGPEISMEKPFSYGGAGRLESELNASGFHSVTIEPVARTASYDSALDFVVSGLGAAASVMPQFANIPPQEMAATGARIFDRIKAEIAPFVDGDGLNVTWRSDIAVAIA